MRILGYLTQVSSKARCFAVALSLTGLVTAQAQGTKGTITLITGFGQQGYSEPGQLIEVSPGTFAGLARGTPTAFLLSTQGILTQTYAFPANTLLGANLLQAVNGRLYGSESQIPGQVDFSLDLSGQIATYPPTVTTYAPSFSIQEPDGSLYGTEWSYSGHNAFVRMTLDGATTVLHNFSAQEGIPHVRPILASDGNFYGISGLGSATPPKSTSAMVYRVTPSGDLTILVTYADGRVDYAPSSFQESLIQASNGNLYGTAALGGANQAGAIFELSLTGGFKILYEVKEFPVGSPTFLTEGTDGNLYGVVQGQVGLGGPSSLFRMTLAGQLERLQWLNGSQIGTCPCWMTLGSDGKFYGTTASGGPGQGSAWTWDLGMPKPKPGVEGMQPTTGAVGTAITIWGEFLLGATAVSFNGTPAIVFGNVSANYVTATVPAGATSGPITVTTPN